MTGAEGYDYCSIYLNGIDRASATELVASTFDSTADRHLVRVDQTEFEVLPNPDVGLAPDFVGWPVKIEVESIEPGPAIVGVVSRLLIAAWSAGYQAVAACDFEDELPERGGYPRNRS